MDIDLIMTVVHRVRDQVLDEDLDGLEAIDLLASEMQDEYEYLNSDDLDLDL